MVGWVGNLQAVEVKFPFNVGFIAIIGFMRKHSVRYLFTNPTVPQSNFVVRLTAACLLGLHAFLIK